MFPVISLLRFKEKTKSQNKKKIVKTIKKEHIVRNPNKRAYRPLRFVQKLCPFLNSLIILTTHTFAPSPPRSRKNHPAPWGNSSKGEKTTPTPHHGPP